MIEYQIVQRGVVIGRFRSKSDRDGAFDKHIIEGYKAEVNK